jgi:hypothetical protein
MTEIDPHLFATQAEFSRQRDVSRKSVTVWKAQGYVVLNDDGLVDVVASNALLAARPTSYRGGVTKDAPAGNGSGARSPDAPILDEAPEAIASAEGWTLAEAQRVKETYLARLRQQEFEENDRQLVRIEEVGAAVDSEYGMVRERLLTLPGKLADRLSPEQVAAVRAEINEALSELHGPDELAR